MSDPPETKCPKCGKIAKRIISQTSFTLKGGGWYKDGYSTKASTNTVKQEKKKTEKETSTKAQAEIKK